MLCEKCKKKEATVHYREIINGKETTYLLCADCAKEMERSGEICFSSPKMFGEGELFDSVFGSLFAPSGARGVSEAKKCPLCGATFDRLVKEGKVGCAKCYDTFKTELERTLTGIHGRDTAHTGKSPAKLRDKLGVKQRIAALERELKQAISDERYERAAELRDELNELRAK